MDGPGTLEDLNSTGDQKNWFEQAAGRGSSWVKTSQNFDDASSPPEMTAATINGRLDLLTTIAMPGQALMSNGLGFLVSLALSPIIEILEWGVGDPEQMRATGQGWAQIADWLDGIAEQEGPRAEATADVWRGEDADAFREGMAEFPDGVTALASEIRGLQSTLNTIADLFDMFVEFAVTMITEFVIGLIVQWLAALAASWITGGASVAAAQAGTVTQTAVTGGRAANALRKLQGMLRSAFKMLEKCFQAIRKLTGKLMDRFKLLKAAGKVGGFVFPKSKLLLPGKGGSLATTARFAPDGAEALAARMSGMVLSGILGGKGTWGRAAFEAATNVGTGAAIEYASDKAYAEGEGALTGDNRSSEERQSDMDDGFKW
ncbi:hypothetical protein FAB82_14685 [Glycomyces buryatensis]|uniref:WXG100 family type VII secretion target n=2 Tax=Glycomyces buryatensis TaxID=2570927 RepID=A0A4S8QIX4_9ACTN|nr:hypothetical protein FAB82_14685 [Glycomyces buryatensis]